MKKYNVEWIEYHSCKVEAKSKEDALKQADSVMGENKYWIETFCGLDSEYIEEIRN